MPTIRRSGGVLLVVVLLIACVTVAISLSGSSLQKPNVARLSKKAAQPAKFEATALELRHLFTGQSFPQANWMSILTGVAIFSSLLLGCICHSLAESRSSLKNELEVVRRRIQQVEWEKCQCISENLVVIDKQRRRIEDLEIQLSAREKGLADANRHIERLMELQDPDMQNALAHARKEAAYYHDQANILQDWVDKQQLREIQMEMDNFEQVKKDHEQAIEHAHKEILVLEAKLQTAEKEVCLSREAKVACEMAMRVYEKENHALQQSKATLETSLQELEKEKQASQQAQLACEAMLQGLEKEKHGLQQEKAMACCQQTDDASTVASTAQASSSFETPEEEELCKVSDQAEVAKVTQCDRERLLKKMAERKLRLEGSEAETQFYSMETPRTQEFSLATPRALDEEVAPETAASNADAVVAAEPSIEEILAEARQALEQASADGRLQGILATSASYEAAAKKPAAEEPEAKPSAEPAAVEPEATPSVESELEKLRKQAKVTLLQASGDGTLAATLQPGKEAAVEEKTEATTSRQPPELSPRGPELPAPELT